MINVSCDVKGVKSAIEKAVLSTVTEHVKKSVGSVRCEEHNEVPSVLVKGNSINNLSYEVGGCCEAVIQKVKAKLK